MSVLDTLIETARARREAARREEEERKAKAAAKAIARLNERLETVLGPLWEELRPFATFAQDGALDEHAVPEPAYKVDHPKLQPFYAEAAEIRDVGPGLRFYRPSEGTAWLGTSLEDWQLPGFLLASAERREPFSDCDPFGEENPDASA